MAILDIALDLKVPEQALDGIVIGLGLIVMVTFMYVLIKLADSD